MSISLAYRAELEQALNGTLDTIEAGARQVTLDLTCLIFTNNALNAIGTVVAITRSIEKA